MSENKTIIKYNYNLYGNDKDFIVIKIHPEDNLIHNINENIEELSDNRSIYRMISWGLICTMMVFIVLLLCIVAIILVYIN